MHPLFSQPQVRSYVLDPYQRVRDLRTGIERGDAFSVLDGDIDCFLEAAIRAGLNRPQPKPPGWEALPAKLDAR